MIPAVDYPTHVVETSNVANLPTKTWEVTEAVAKANLVRLPEPVHHEVQPDENDLDTVVHVLVSEDFFGASRFLVLDQILDVDHSRGLLVAVPNRHLLAVHAPTGTGVVAAIEMLAKMAIGESGGVGPLSPHVYYVAPDGTHQVITHHEGQNLSITIEGPLLETFLDLGIVTRPEED